MNQTTDEAFGTYVKPILLTRGAWKSRTNLEQDEERVLLRERLLAFLEDTPRTLWKQMRDLHGLSRPLENPTGAHSRPFYLISVAPGTGFS